MNRGIVVIGGGQAASAAVIQFRSGGYSGPLTIVGDEPYLPYERPPLSKSYLAGKIDYDKLFFRSEQFYTAKNIDVLTDTRVSSINTAEQTLATESGEVRGYDQLLLATGSRPRKLTLPGADLVGVQYLRSLRDVDALKLKMRDTKRICMIGGGYIGLELAAVAVSLGFSVTVIESEDRILKRVTTAQMSHFYQDLHRHRGVTIKCNKKVVALDGDQTVRAVVCEDETIPTDIVLVGIGAIPNTELAESAGVSCTNGIWVDEHCRTSQAGIYAAGDCTNHPNPFLGRRLRLESAPNAIEQGRIAASNMLGGNDSYASVPWFWSDQYDLKLQVVGFSSDGTQSICRGDIASNRFSMFYLQDDKVVAVEAVNSPKDFMVGKRIYGKKVDVTRLADTSIDLKELLKTLQSPTA